MKKLLLFAGLALAFASCDKSAQEDLNEDTFTVKVVAAICSEAVLEILDDDYTQNGQATWTQGNVTYNNVFFTQFNCEDLENFGKLARPSLIGLELKVKITEQNLGDCAVCLATIADPPATKHFVDVVE